MQKVKTKEVSPILVIGIPRSYGGQRVDEIFNNIRQVKQEDYFILPYVQNEGNEFTFQVFYDKDWQETSYEELRNKLLSNYK